MYNIAIAGERRMKMNLFIYIYIYIISFLAFKDKSTTPQIFREEEEKNIKKLKLGTKMQAEGKKNDIVTQTKGQYKMLENYRRCCFLFLNFCEFCNVRFEIATIDKFP